MKDTFTEHRTVGWYVFFPRTWETSFHYLLICIGFHDKWVTVLFFVSLNKMCLFSLTAFRISIYHLFSPISIWFVAMQFFLCLSCLGSLNYFNLWIYNFDRSPFFLSPVSHQFPRSPLWFSNEIFPKCFPISPGAQTPLFSSCCNENGKFHLYRPMWLYLYLSVSVTRLTLRRLFFITKMPTYVCSQTQQYPPNFFRTQWHLLLKSSFVPLFK